MFIILLTKIQSKCLVYYLTNLGKKNCTSEMRGKSSTTNLACNFSILIHLNAAPRYLPPGVKYNSHMPLLDMSMLSSANGNVFWSMWGIETSSLMSIMLDLLGGDYKTLWNRL